jgi:hypothetical protein
MANNTSPSGIANASSNATAAYIAFNRDYNYRNNWVSATNNTGWVSYQFPTSRIIKRYTIQGGDSAVAPTSNGWNPRDWTFQGSNDGVSWVTLETVTGFALPFNGNYVSPILPNTTPYTYYRVNVTAVQTLGNPPRFSEIEMTESTDVAGGASGGSFNFNTAGVTVSATSTSSSLSAGATNLITVTATTGTVTLSLGSAVTGINIASSQIFNYTGNCNFTLNGVRFNGAVNATELRIGGNLINQSNWSQ